MIDVLVVIPVYNHGQTLRQVAEQALDIFTDVLVVDDGSTDGGIETLVGLPVRLVQHDTNRGKGQAILTAAEEARRLGKTHLITLDADGQHFPSDIPAFLAAIQEDPRAVVVGARDFSGENIPGASVFGRRFSNFWLRVQTGVCLSDVQCGFRAYPLAIFSAVTLNERRFAFEVEVLVRSAWAGYPLKDVDIHVHYPKPDERISHFRALRDNVEISLLNTRLTARSFLPVPHRRYTEDETGRVSPVHPIKSLRLLLEKNETPWQLALAAGLGMLLGTLPLIGLHCLAIVFVLGYFRLSKIMGLAVSQLCIPPFVPALCVEAGYYLRHGQFLTDISMQTLGYEALERIWEYVLGTLVLGPAFGLLTGVVVYGLARIVRSRLSRDRAEESLP
ncbi:DUF2062 domain-containing protein [Pseudodesulfovibrio thermohalotolerans]|uniref:DUF2062 domain-containing protein n=1 Tax=Pseudodesulfovibrio thermohalotolerans TaxID=2880651 RepID=UPI00244230AB|nr:DUF2062 domain-containing protein [Pseudodesulfovibrio thermohalotolerans]WFS63858.1 DUF2062 domain-containing protein [Pseudodesulfovibrio thermohalotolerans]